ncbi:polyunsaturated fatty acid elongation enzyme [Blyttiomyces helicus]|uniref:Elongation of fatty acids protein n=1 Tax=Blyttiomyces helicus TaxID=388810 RepID=A0A4P9WPM0_9FUNG|nr:polyunsaturated fatty acid elongation enzyme [Blyttiomyces helicus]|eukprot:RKO93200.1 polyunsaturated fatty acid elongation enzyme [Blyttiomyces helicus]
MEAVYQAATQAVSYPVEDIFLNIARRSGTILAPHLAPLQSLLSHQLRTTFPSFAVAAERWLRTTQNPLSAKLPLGNPFHVVLILGGYFAVVFFGKALMGGVAKPFKAKTLMMLHNLFLLTLSAYMCGSILVEARRAGYSLWGNSVDVSEGGIKMSKLAWLFYYSKIFEFVDTFIMVIKKNNRQISFLHIYHHASIFCVWYDPFFSSYTCPSYFSAALNSFIHVVMYGYYFFSAIGIKQVSFIKRYITAMQMTQFCAMMCQAIYNMYSAHLLRDDPAALARMYPPNLSTLLFFYMWTMLGLFANFFVQDARRAAKERREKALAGKEDKKRV